MKTKKFFLVIALVATVLPQILFAQTDSANTKIENRILSYENSDLFIIANARKILADKVKAGQKDTIREIYSYLHKKYDNQQVLPFYEYEDVMLSLYMGDYDKLLDSKIIDSCININYYGYTLPLKDNLIGTLEKQFNKERSAIEHAIDTSNLTDENKAWLRLLFHFLSYDGNDTLQNYEVINTEADSFLQNYSSSEKIDFVKEYIRYRYAVSPWGFGGEFFTGGGFYNGRLSNSFTNTVAFGFDVDIYYKKTIFYLRELFGISGSIKQDFNYKNYWHENEPLILFFPELSVGYTVAETRHFSLAPFGGIASAYIHLSPAVADTATNNVELPYKTTYVAGINIDFKFSSSGDIAYNVPYYKARAWYIRLRLAYCATTFQELDPRFNGNIFYFTIGVGAYGHKIKRV